MSFYRLFRSLLFALPPEKSHEVAMQTLRYCNNVPFLSQFLSASLQQNSASVAKKLWNLHFKNPLGLAAGFDKNGVYLKEIALLNFGFAEVGTVTPLPQAGNEKPRLFRLPKDKALINRMGFNNNGVKALRKQLEYWKTLPTSVTRNMLVGANIGKNKITKNELAWKDYEVCFNELFYCADYFVINVSSPNTPNLRQLQEKEFLRKIVSHLQIINYGKEQPKPLLLKIAPDLSPQQLDDILALSFEEKLSGIVATNTTIQRINLKTSPEMLKAIGEGGLSGKPLLKMSTKVVEYLTYNSEGKMPIIASGGIFTAADAKEKIKAGASLLQLYTGFIYEGPALIKKLNKALAER